MRERDRDRQTDGQRERERERERVGGRKIERGGWKERKKNER